MTDLLARIERGELVEAQEIFDFAVGKVIEQGVPSVGEGGCIYRNDLGQKCAFGHLIPDSLYESRFEGGSVYSILNNNRTSKYSSRLTASLGQHLDLVADLQGVHDSLSNGSHRNFVDSFRHRAKAIAERHGLTFNF